MRQLVPHEGCKHRVFIIERGKINADDNAPAICDRNLALAHQFKPGGADFNRSHAHCRAVCKANFDTRLCGKQRIYVIVGACNPLPVHAFCARPFIGINPPEPHNLAVAGKAPCKISRRALRRRLHREIAGHVERGAGDFGAAFDFASDNLQAIFGSPENFGLMVRNGYPMVLDPAELRFLDRAERQGRMVQRVLILDRDGRSYLLEYEMIGDGAGMRIAGVRILPETGAGV